MIKLQPEGRVGVPVIEPEVTLVSVAPERLVPARLRPLKDWFDKFAPDRFAPGPTR